MVRIRSGSLLPGESRIDVSTIEVQGAEAICH